MGSPWSILLCSTVCHFACTVVLNGGPSHNDSDSQLCTALCGQCRSVECSRISRRHDVLLNRSTHHLFELMLITCMRASKMQIACSFKVLNSGTEIRSHSVVPASWESPWGTPAQRPSQSLTTWSPRTTKTAWRKRSTDSCFKREPIRRLPIQFY